MWPYWLLFIWPMFGVLARRRLMRRDQAFVWALTIAVFSLLIGLRHEVGGDWFTYIDLFQRTSSLGFIGALAFGDPGYYGLNWLVAQLGGNVYAINLICGGIVMIGVTMFARQQPRPWLALLVAVPYLIIVVAMGYTRQSVALGFALVALTALGQQRLIRFVFWVLLGALFHKSAVLLLPIAALAASRNRLWTLVWVGALSAVGAALLVGAESETLWTNYVVAGYQSEGGLTRVAMNAVPAVLLLIFGKWLVPDDAERKLWMWMAVLTLACLPLVLISSTAVDRVALYFIPIQMYVFARLDRLATSASRRTLIVVGIVAYYAAVEWVWLNYAKTAFAWVPYHFMPLQ